MGFEEIYYLCVIGIFGLVFGSFLTCAAMRIAEGEDFIHGRSRCISCGHELGAADLIPVISWLLLRGRCRYCRNRISAAYPLSEILFALLVIGIYIKHGVSVESARDVVLAGCLFVLSVVDIKCFEIPDGCLVIALAAWMISAPFMGYDLKTIASYVFSGLGCGIVMLGFSLLVDKATKKESLGGGDIKLFALLGLYLGMAHSYFMVLVSCIIGLIFAGVKSFFPPDIYKENHLEEDTGIPPGAFPFGPSISLAGYVMLLSGDKITQWYLNLF